MGVREDFWTWRRDRSAGDKTQHGVMGASFLFLVGLIVVSVLLGRSIPADADVSTSGVGLTSFLLFSAAAAVGAALGFLFGLPRARLAEAVEGAASPAAVTTPGGGTSTATETPPATGKAPASTHYLTNSNLIKVSDWLTTIIIGLGLVNLGKLAPAVTRLEAELQEPLGGTPHAGIVGVSLLVVGALAGILLAFLWTTIRVRELFEEAEWQLRTTVPDLNGLTVRAAKELLGTTTLKLVAPARASDDATITSQSLRPGMREIRGAEVCVAVQPARGTAPSRTATPIREAATP